MPYKRILIPTDFSEHSYAAFLCGVELARVFKAEIVLLTVIDDAFPYPELYSVDFPERDYYKSLREAALDKMRSYAAHAPDVAVEFLTRKGKPHTEILGVGADTACDVIVMATHGTSGIQHALLGSVTEKVIRKATLPVLVLPGHRPNLPNP